MSNTSDWYGQNNINWGKSYSQSWWGSVNESNSWGLIYPESAEGSIVLSDTTSFTADTTSLTADIGIAGSLATFACSDAGFTIQDGTTGDSISLVNDASVIKGTLNSISPATYQSGSSTYTANITIPAGYSNSGQTITTCTDTATGSAVSEPTATSTYWWSPNQANFVGVGQVQFTYTFGGITYYQGVVDTSTELSDYNGDSLDGGTSSRSLKIDTATPQVGTYIYEADGTIIKENQTYGVVGNNFGPYENFATPRFISIKSSSGGAFGGNTFSPFPIYKLGQVGDYVKIIEIITS